MTSLLPTINLPTQILFHSTGLGLISLILLFRRPGPSEPSSATLGVTSLALSLAYLSTSYMPIAENQFLHASVPVRIILAVLAGIRAFIAKPGEKTGVLWGIFLYDGLGALLLGWSLGRWNGRIPAY